MSEKRPIAVWLAGAVSFCAAAWGVWQLVSLTRFGFIAPLEFLATAVASLAAIVGVLMFRWWGLLVGAVLAAYVIVIAPYASPPSILAALVFYAPLVFVATLKHRAFRWF